MSRGRILVVDDENFFRKLYEGILLPEGFFVRTVEGGKEAAAILKKESFDIVITDLVMPDWDGIRTVEEIKKIRPDQDIIMVTHISELETAVEAMKSGASDYILKPIREEALLSSVRKLLKRQKIFTEHSRLVQENIEHFEILSTYKKCLDILSIDDFDRLIDTTVDAMVADTGAREGILWISDSDMKGLWNIAGIVSEYVKEKASLPAGEDSWLERMKIGVPFLWPDKKGRLFVPLMLQQEILAVVELYAKRGSRLFDERDLKNVGIIAEFAQVALNKAKKINALAAHTFKDDDFGLYSFPLLMDCMKRQISVASRYGRPFSVVYLKIHNLEELKDAFGAETVRTSVVRIVSKVKGVIRDSDVMAMKDEGEYCVLLTETDYFGSIMAIKRIEDGTTGIKYVSDGESSMPVSLVVTAVSYPRDGFNIEKLLDTVINRTEEVQESLFQRLNLSEEGYPESVDIILGRKAGEEIEERGGGALPEYVYSDLSGDLYIRMRELFVREIMQRHHLRGLLFLGVDTVSPADDFCKKIASVKDLATRVFVVGKKGDKEWNIPHMTPVYLKENEEPFSMILFLNEEAGYAFLGKKRPDGSSCSFHTSDMFMVEKLISKLREHYLLQWV